MEIELNRDRCEGFGFCEDVAPEIFELDDDGELVVLIADVPEHLLPRAEEAIKACPVAALKARR
jgi:ferredoxin